MSTHLPEPHLPRLVAGGARRTLAAAVALGVALFVLAGSPLVGSASAAGSPWWHLSVGSRPSSLEAGGQGEIVLIASNLGDANANGAQSPVQIAAELPAGVRARSIRGVAGVPGALERGPVQCKQPAGPCEFEGSLPPYDQIELRLAVEVEEGVESGVSVGMSVSGGQASSVSRRQPLRIGGEPSFGVEEFSLAPEEEGGALDAQAGSHPFQLTSTLTLNQTADSTPTGPGGSVDPVALAKDLNFKLPPGLIGNPTPFAQCTLKQFLTHVIDPIGNINLCPAQTALGVAIVTVSIRNSAGSGVTITPFTVPVFNLEPGVGEPARFGFAVLGTPVFLDTSVRTGGDYGVTVSVHNITESVAFLRSQVTFWGVPGDPRHDPMRGWGCLEAAREVANPGAPCEPSKESQPPPFLALPTSCTGPLQAAVEADSWADPRRPVPLAAGEPFVALDGCNRLPFEPSIKVTPDGTAASTPTGLNVDVHVPQQESLNANGLTVSDPKGIVVALPPGVAVNPSSGDGLAACSEGLVGFTGFAETPLLPGFSLATFTGSLPTPLAQGVNFCPDASKIGTARIKTPLLANPIEGGIYIASQNQNPFGGLVAIYIVAEDPVSGVLIKLAGQTQLCQSAGETLFGMACEAQSQLVTRFEDSPQAPFEDAELHFFGGERAPLTSPARCGSYTTHAAFTSWSAKADEAPATASSAFSVTSGPNGSPCPGASLPFNPVLTGGTVNINAGSFTPLSTTIGRESGQQDMQSVTLHMPPGVSGLLSNVKLCPEAQANEGACGPESLIGETTVAAGVGGDPVSVKGGKVYITEKYAGAPFGLSIVNPVKAGPFDLEHDTSRPGQYTPGCDCLVVRAKIEVDPVTAALTVTTDPSGPHAIPHLIDGIPVQIQKVNVLINRPGFTFNPTNCNPTSITGAMAGEEGASSPVSVPFQVANCANLAFKPGFSVFTSGKTSRKNGASLHVKLTYPKAPFGSQANIKSVKVELPKQLPSELKTLQHACPHEVFEANPAGCSSASTVGFAKATTPLLPVPLEGPAYFVSYGGKQFPELIVVLQGYGVTLDLHGETFINEKTSITSSTFHTVPDAPVGSFELNLPEGPFSALGANGNLCALTKTVLVRRKVTVRSGGRRRTVTRKVRRTVPATLAMPTTFIAQNGATIKQRTPIGVTGCARHKAGAKKAAKARRSTGRH
ncbi:MAG: hypothetical protein ACRDK4_15895 [Solirubrobacteraceae bacterium]